jgi:hypothetical protein
MCDASVRGDVVDGFEYKGYTYDHDLDIEPEENCKINHMAVKGEKRVHMDWSPYSTPSMEDFELWIDLDMPERINGGPLDRDDLEFIKASGMRTYRVLISFVNGFGEEVERLQRITCCSHAQAEELAVQNRPSAKIIHCQQDRLRVNHG